MGEAYERERGVLPATGDGSPVCTDHGEGARMIILLVLAAVIVGAPIVAALLVAVASLREDAERSLAGRAPGWLTAAARRLLRMNSAGSSSADVPQVPRQRTADHDEPARPLPRPQP